MPKLGRKCAGICSSQHDVATKTTARGGAEEHFMENERAGHTVPSLGASQSFPF